LRLGLRRLAALPGVAEDLAGAGEHRLRDAALAGDGERAAAAGETGVQAVLRPPGLLVELHRGGDRVRARRREGLDRVQMRRDDRAASGLEVRLEERDG